MAVCLIFALLTIQGGDAGLLQTCDNNAECKVENTGDPNAVCSKDMANGGGGVGTCVCTGAYLKKGDADECVAKGLSDKCDTASDCAHVDNSDCSSSQCSCAGGYKVDGTSCIKVSVRETPCLVGNSDCKAANSECDGADNTPKCKCSNGYQQDSTDNTMCTAVSVLETLCPDGNTDCKAANSECDGVGNSPKCKCSNGYQQDSTDNTMCTAVLGISCTGPTDCTDHVENSACPTTGKCSCATNYIKDGNVCAKELGQSCSAGECVTNAKCDTTCTCAEGYVDTNGLCAVPSSTITTKLSTSVAVMSILCMAVRNTF